MQPDGRDQARLWHGRPDHSCRFCQDAVPRRERLPDKRRADFPAYEAVTKITPTVELFVSSRLRTLWRQVVQTLVVLDGLDRRFEGGPAGRLLVEEAFRARLATLSADRSNAAPDRNGSKASARSRRTPAIDKAELALPEPRRVRDREHVRSVAQKACLVCGRHPSDPHHVRFAQSRPMGRKVSDEFTVPLCRGHHRELHRFGDEAAWWQRQGIDPTPVARALWLESHPLPEIEISTATATNHPTVTDRTLPSMTKRTGERQFT